MRTSQFLVHRSLTVLPLIALGWVVLVFGSGDTEGLRQSSVRLLFASLLARAICFAEWLAAGTCVVVRGLSTVSPVW